MESVWGNWPSYDPHNFSQLKPSDPTHPSVFLEDPALIISKVENLEITCAYRYKLAASRDHVSVNNLHVFSSSYMVSEPGFVKLVPVTYHPTHNRTTPPANQVITTEATNILLRQFYQRAEEKLRPKRAASESLVPEHGSKQLKGCQSDDTLPLE